MKERKLVNKDPSKIIFFGGWQIAAPVFIYKVSPLPGGVGCVILKKFFIKYIFLVIIYYQPAIFSVILFYPPPAPPMERRFSYINNKLKLTKY
jgi:hypothetical protein